MEIEVIEEVEVIVVEFEDHEVCAREGRKPRHAKAYRIVVDRTPFTVRQHSMTGAEILALVGKSADAWALSEKLHGGRRERIQPSQVVVFHHHAVERFETSPNKVKNGEVALGIPLTADDRAFLDGRGYNWSVIKDGEAWAVIIKGYRLPAGLVPQIVDLMFRVPLHYPVSKLDMVNTLPPAGRRDGRSLPNLSLFSFQGAQWQQWSRHLPDCNPWNPEVDCVATHFAFIEGALAHDAA